MKSKFFAIVMAVLLVFTMTACSNDGESKSTKKDKNTKTEKNKNDKSDSKKGDSDDIDPDPTPGEDDEELDEDDDVNPDPEADDDINPDPEADDDINPDPEAEGEHDDLPKHKVGEVIKSDGFDVTVKKVSTKASKKKGKKLVILDVELKNMTDDTREISFEISGVYDNENVELDLSQADSTLVEDGVEAHKSVRGKLAYYADSASKKFYVVIRPNMDDFDDQRKVEFSVK